MRQFSRPNSSRRPKKLERASLGITLNGFADARTMMNSLLSSRLKPSGRKAHQRSDCVTGGNLKSLENFGSFSSSSECSLYRFSRSISGYQARTLINDGWLSLPFTKISSPTLKLRDSASSTCTIKLGLCWLLKPRTFI